MSHILPRWSRLFLMGLVGFLSGCQSDPLTPSMTCSEVGEICTIMGTGVLGFAGEADAPENVALYWPIDLTYDVQDRLLVLDYNNQRVRRLDPDNRVRTILGTGFEAEVVDGTPALESPLHHAFSMAYDGAGNLYLAGNHIPQIIKLSTDNRVYVVAGTDAIAFGGDGGPALTAELNYPCGVDVASVGFPIYVADTYNHCVRVIDKDGIIHNLAGTGGVEGFSGDDGMGSAATLSYPFRVRLHEPTGDVYVTDFGNHAIRKIDAAGVITTVAGTGIAGYSGDGGQASEAQLNLPLDAQLGPDGALYIADTGNDRIRRVDSSGFITTVAGAGTRGRNGEFGPALDAELNHPSAITFDPDGNLLISDSYSSIIRRVILTKP